jgi:hypothetical protein
MPGVDFGASPAHPTTSEKAIVPAVSGICSVAHVTLAARWAEGFDSQKRPCDFRCAYAARPRETPAARVTELSQ